MEKITLKILVNHQNKHVIIPLLTGIFLALYTACGAFGYQHAVRLTMSEFEQNLPFWTDTIWIYIILYPVYLIWALYSYKDLEEMNKTLFGFVLLTLISCVFFIFFPVTYPREMFPLPLNNNLSTLIFRATRELDKPNNCLPSLHVGLCYLFAFGFYRENKKKFWISIFISSLVAVSTLTTKQHYIYDIALGFIISFCLFIFFDRKVEVK
jgi:membrane-associated phospholipid phosphatase